MPILERTSLISFKDFLPKLGVLSISASVFSEDNCSTGSVNYEIRGWNNHYWLTNENCSTFAVEIWNLLSDADFSLSWPDTPSELKTKIKENVGYCIIDEMPVVSNYGISYYGYYDSETNTMIKTLVEEP